MRGSRCRATRCRRGEGRSARRVAGLVPREHQLPGRRGPRRSRSAPTTGRSRIRSPRAWDCWTRRPSRDTPRSARRRAVGAGRRSMRRAFRQVDVFTETPYLGNPVAVVHDADGLRRGDGAVRPVDEPVRNDVPAGPHRARSRLPGPDLHPDDRAAVRGAPDPWAPATRGSRRVGSRAQAIPIVQECPAGLIRSADRRGPRVPAAAR